MVQHLFLNVFAILTSYCVLAKIQIELLPSFEGTVLEEPHWDESSRRLFYVDIAGSNSSIQCYDPRENKVYKATIDDAPLITYIIPIECVENQFLVGMKHRSYIVEWNGKSSKAKVIKPLFDLDCGEQLKSNVINDLKADRYGRIYGGMKSVESCSNLTLSQATGSFYRFERGRCPEKLFGNIFISNGLTWVGNKFYYADSCANDIKQFDYNPESGDLSYESKIFSLTKTNQKPDFVIDGMTSDINGNLYAATFGGSKIMKIDSRTGNVLMNIEMPTSQITSCVFGGTKLNILYVTTANKDGKQPKPAGRLFKITGLCTTGHPGSKVKIYESCTDLQIKYLNCCPFCLNESRNE